MNIEEIKLPEDYLQHLEGVKKAQTAPELVEKSKEYLAFHRGYVKSLHEGRELIDSDVCRTMAKGVDLILQYYYERFDGAKHFVLCALGGYGRGIMNPASDVDLLLLLRSSSVSKKTEAAVNEFLTPLWDIGLKIGHSVRDQKACMEEAEMDPYNRTAMLDSRFLAGDRGVFDKFYERYWRKRIDKQCNEFVQERVQVTLARHENYSHTVFLQEPNVKESPGGLRD